MASSQRVRATNGYIYERGPDGKMVRVGRTEEGGYSPSEQYDAANRGEFRDGGDIDGYLDTIMDVSGMGDKNVQGTPSGDAGTGSGKGGKSTEASDSSAEASADKDADGNWIVPAAVAAGGVAAITAWLASRGKKKSKQQSTVADPATDTAGAADEGGPSEGVDTRRSWEQQGYDDSINDPKNWGNAGDDLAGLPAPDNIVEGIYEELGMPKALGGPQAALPAPEPVMPNQAMADAQFVDDPEVMQAYDQGASQKAIPMGTQAPAQNPELPDEALDPETQAWLDQVTKSANPVDESIAAVDGPNAPHADPNMEAGLQSYAQRLREQMKVDPFAMDKMRAGPTGDMPSSVMQRLKAIIASGAR